LIQSSPTYRSYGTIFAELIFGLANSSEPTRFPAFEKHFLALFSARMDRTKSGDGHKTIRDLDPHVTNKRPRGDEVKEIIGSDVEIEFLEDKENRWEKIFELLGGEINSQ
jgi:hypothetical protein